MSKVTELASSQITPSDTVAIELIEADETSSVVIIRWPLKATVLHPRRFPDTAAVIVRQFAGRPRRWPESERAGGFDRPGCGLFYAVKIPSGCSGSGCLAAPQNQEVRNFVQAMHERPRNSHSERPFGRLLPPSGHGPHAAPGKRLGKLCWSLLGCADHGDLNKERGAKMSILHFAYG